MEPNIFAELEREMQKLEREMQSQDEQARIRADLIRIREKKIRKLELESGKRLFPKVERADSYYETFAHHTRFESDVLSLYSEIKSGVDGLWRAWEWKGKPMSSEMSFLLDIALPEARNDVMPIIGQAGSVLRDIASITFSYMPGEELPARDENDVPVVRMEEEISKFYRGIVFSFRYYYPHISKALSAIKEGCETQAERAAIYPLIFDYQNFRHQLPGKFRDLRKRRIETFFMDFVN